MLNNILADKVFIRQTLYHLKRLSILTLQFYRLLLPYNIAFTLVGFVLILPGGMQINASGFLCAKLMGLSAAIIVYNYTSKLTFYYFRNAGFRARWIALATLIPDLLVYCLIVILTIIVRNA